LGPELSIVIPAHNEAARLNDGFARLRPVVDAIGVDLVEVIVIDDGSSDATGPVAAGIYGALPHAQVVRHDRNRGKGAAVRLGLAIATGHRVVICDADMAIDPAHIPEMIAALDGAPIAFGSRAVDGEIRYRSWMRTRAGAIFNSIVRRRVGTELRDTQCGFKAMRIGPARLLACLGVIDGFAFDVELISLARRTGLAIATVPVQWDDVRGSSVRPFSDSPRMLRDIGSIGRFDYAALAVRAPRDVSREQVAGAAQAARSLGLVIATGQSDSLVVLPRDGALVATAIAAAVSGSLGTVPLDELRGRTLTAV
jgi:dolichyl-phosphate beta-glucosyltransferase